jgi:hypothetical protein
MIKALMKLKRFFAGKETVTGLKRQVIKWEKISSIFSSDK